MTKREVLAGTDGFRGEAVLDQTGPGIINEETFAGLSAALADYTQEQGNDGPFVVGMDTRPCSERLKNAVITGLLSRGAEVLDMGVAPTPGMQRAAMLIGAAGTVAVTASHNPYTDNGWKGMIGAEKPNKDQVNAISDRYWDLVENKFRATADPDQAVDLHEEFTERYIDDIQHDVEMAFGRKPLRGKRMVVDGAYGAGGEITATVLERLGAEVHTFACGTNGVINAGVGAADLSGLKSFLENNYTITLDSNFLGAVANDGDADRMMALGVRYDVGKPQLVEVNGNHAMWAMAQGELGIVGTEYTNGGLRAALKEAAVEFEECANGDVHVTAALKQKQQQGQNWNRGGEFTGHLVDLKWLSSGDGPRNAAWVSAWAATNGLTFGDVHRELPLWHEKMAKVRVAHKEIGERILSSPDMIEWQETLQDASVDPIRFVIRQSGTEPVLRIWGESREAYSVDSAISQLTTIAQNVAKNI